MAPTLLSLPNANLTGPVAIGRANFKRSQQNETRISVSLQNHGSTMGSKLTLSSRNAFSNVAGRRSSAPRAMVSATSDNPSLVAKEMERVAAKESLIFATKDAGGLETLSSGKGNSASKIEVSEKILALERLNPTPRPTTSPLLEGVWEFVWAGARSPGTIAARILLKRFPEQLAKLNSLTLEVLQGGSRATASVKLLTSVETSFTLTTRLAVEGPVRLKEEYVEGVLSTPTIPESDTPSPLKGIFDQIQSLSTNLPESIKEAIASGLKLSLSGTFSRELLISYLDDEIMIVRDQSGLADVLVRSVAPLPEPGFEPYDDQLPE